MRLKDNLNIADKKLTKQLYIVIRTMPEFGNKLWVGATIRKDNREWIASFHDLYWIIKFIGECEDIKYPPKNGFKGKQMVLEFLVDCLSTDLTFEQLAVKYKLPERL